MASRLPRTALELLESLKSAARSALSFRFRQSALLRNFDQLHSQIGEGSGV
jgi:hypothetical protein